MCAQDLEQVLVQVLVAKFDRCDDSLTAREVKNSALFTVGISELPKQYQLTSVSSKLTSTSAFEIEPSESYFILKSLLTKNIASLPGKYPWQELFKSPRHSFLF